MPFRNERPVPGKERPFGVPHPFVLAGRVLIPRSPSVSGVFERGDARLEHGVPRLEDRTVARPHFRGEGLRRERVRAFGRFRRNPSRPAETLVRRTVEGGTFPVIMGRRNPGILRGRTEEPLGNLRRFEHESDVHGLPGHSGGVVEAFRVSFETGIRSCNGSNPRKRRGDPPFRFDGTVGYCFWESPIEKCGTTIP